MEESPLDRVARRGAAWKLVFAAAYCALVVYLLVNPHTRIIGVFNVVIVGFILSWYALKVGLDEAPQWARRIVFSGWHGNYRAFEDRRVRVIEGQGHEPSRVYATDIFAILGISPSEVELAKLAARYGTGFEQASEGDAAGEWLFMDQACVEYARGHHAHKLVLWLERTVFMPIDNRRSRATGKTYAFSREAARR